MWPEQDAEASTSLTSMGIDSLVSVEIRNWYRRTLGAEISVLEITNAGTLGRLGNLAITSLQKKYHIKEGFKSVSGAHTKPNGNGEFKSDVEIDDISKFDLVKKVSSFTAAPLGASWPTQPAICHFAE